jgi:hypothetical protein
MLGTPSIQSSRFGYPRQSRIIKDEDLSEAKLRLYCSSISGSSSQTRMVRRRKQEGNSSLREF